MLTIKEGALELFSSSHKNVYFFSGPEYGVKKEYIEKLSKEFNYTIENYDSFQSVIDLFKTKSLFNTANCLSIVRYDKKFIASLNQELADKVIRLKVHGIVIGLYEDEKDENKLNKYFDDRTIRFNLMDKRVENTHLTKFFDSLPPNYISSAINMSSNYYQAYNICQSMSYLNNYDLSKSDLYSLFGYESISQEDRFKVAIASKSFKSALEEVESYDGELSIFHYDILSTLLEIYKCLSKSNPNSFVYPYIKKWNKEDVKNFYNETFRQLEQIRSISNYNPYISLVYLLGLLKYRLS